MMVLKLTLLNIHLFCFLYLQFYTVSCAGIDINTVTLVCAGFDINTVTIVCAGFDIKNLSPSVFLVFIINTPSLFLFFLLTHSILLVLILPVLHSQLFWF